MQLNIKEHGHGFTSWMSPQCGALSRDLQDENSPISLGHEVRGYKLLEEAFP